MTGITVAAHLLPSAESWPRRLAVVAVAVALADWLLFRHHAGISLALMIVALAAGVVLANPVTKHRRDLLLASGLLAAAVAPLVEDANLLSLVIGATGLAAFALAATGALRGDLASRCLAVAWLVIGGPLRFLLDLMRLPDWAKRHGVARLAALTGWIVPAAFGAVFLALFASANPLIADWIAPWRLWAALPRLDIPRLAFWIAAVAVAWTFVCHRAEPSAGGEPAVPATPAAARAETASVFFNDRAIRRSLVLFNLMFAVQTAMDIHYLWRGAALPDGMSHAAYAHRGAYPLIATALLAAGFVLAAMRPGSAAERSGPLRVLVFVWVGQNVLLVISAMLRLDLYVETYSLTYWRLAAFVWMLLVAAGLILIVIRIVLARSNGWLVRANLAALTLTLYACAFVDIARVVADYNVDRSHAMASEGRPIDLYYLSRLGPDTLPALDRYIAAQPAPDWLIHRRDTLAAIHRARMTDWRAWSFRGWRLHRYLQNRTAAASLTSH